MRDDHIFIMAPPRSGTEMLSRALGRCPGTYLITEHKRKAEIPEEQNPTPDREFWEQAFGLPRRAQETPEEVEFDPQAFEHLNRLWTAHSGGQRLIIKNPNNVVRAREIRRAFPNAQFVWLLRNPWAVIQSMLGGKDAGRKATMFVGATEVLRHADPLLRAAASWAYAVQVMKQLQSSADITTRYEDLVKNPQQELKRLVDHLKLTFSVHSAEVLHLRKEDFRVVRYLLRRSPTREATIEMLAPIASDLGYPTRQPRGAPGDDWIFGVRYLLTILRRPHKNRLYGFPRLEKMSAAVMKARARMLRRV